MAIAVRGQQRADRVRLIGVLMPYTTDNPEDHNASCLADGLQKLGWSKVVP